MKIFKGPNFSGKWKCPICRTSENHPIVLIPIHGTTKGDMCEAEQFHFDCISLIYFKDIKGLAMDFGKK